MIDAITPIRAPRDRLNHAVEHGPKHLRPVWRAVRDHGCEHAFVLQGPEPFSLASGDRPLIVLLGDDLFEAHGPEGFHRASLLRVIKGSKVAAIVSSGPDPRPYLAACTNAVLLRQSVVIVETRPEREIEWIKFLQDARPGIGLLVCSVDQGRPQ